MNKTIQPTAMKTRLRQAGFTLVEIMVVAALSAIFLSDPQVPNLAGFSAIHLLVPVVLLALVHAFRQLIKGNIRGHRQAMVSLYVSACLVAGAFTLLPGRRLGQLVWGQWMGLV